jgi:hypothetical protein
MQENPTELQTISGKFEARAASAKDFTISHCAILCYTAATLSLI